MAPVGEGLQVEREAEGMDPRERADALLARARARSPFVVTPEVATSPMDAANTQRVPRAVVNRIDREEDPDSTAVVPATLINSVQGDLRSPEPGPQTHVGLPAVRPPEPPEQEVGGLIPTTTKSTGRSDLSRRLEGL
ncbi:hypothetical protein [Amycolatopsis taiwanensis]|uniref:hypothetical protein n=1 Tax=Amycolatopsis taiwanensis TaxID=342230 RepID=UPI0032D9F813